MFSSVYDLDSKITGESMSPALTPPVYLLVVALFPLAEAQVYLLVVALFPLT